MAEVNASKAANRGERIHEKANRVRRARGLPAIEVGFKYREAIEALEREGYSTANIGALMGVARGEVDRYCSGGVPNHVSGEFLWAIACDVFGKDAARTRFCTEAQLKGGTVAARIPRGRPRRR